MPVLAGSKAQALQEKTSSSAVLGGTIFIVKGYDETPLICW